MATETVPNAQSITASLAEARDRIVRQAAGEAAAIAAMLLRDTENLKESGDIDLVLPGALRRIESLCFSVSALQGTRWPDNIADEHRVVFGKPLEVAHV